MIASGDCGRCGLSVKFDVPGFDAAVVPLTGSPLCRVCARRQGFDADFETLTVIHREPRHVTRSFRRGRTIDAQCLDFASSGRAFDAETPALDEVEIVIIQSVREVPLWYRWGIMSASEKADALRELDKESGL